MRHIRLLSTGLSLFLFLTASPVSAQVTGLSDWDIYLDPGHSRRENMGIFNYSEAQKVLRVGLELRDLLLTKTDIDTVYNSRFNDTELVGLSQRTDEANSLDAAWFHSIHSNAGPSQTNNTLLLWGQLRSGEEKTPNGGKAMSDIMIDILTRGMRIATIGSRGDCSFFNCNFTGPYLSVNRRSTMPSELSEGGFHTSPTQNMRNMNAQWKRLEAYSMFWTFLKFHDLERPPVGIVTGFINDLEGQKLLNGATVRIDGQEYTTDTFESLFNQYSTNPEQLRNGFYFLEDLPNDTLEMIVEAEDFISDTLHVFIEDTFFTFVDVDLISSLPPVVRSTTPVQNADRIPPWEPIVINFSRRMDAASIDSAIVIAPPANLSTAWQDANRILIIQTDTLVASTDYTVTLRGTAADLFEHPFDGDGDGVGGDDFILSFRTQPEDVDAPRIASIYPPSSSTGIENPPVINFGFDENLATDSIDPDMIVLERLSDGQSVPGTQRHYVVGGRSLLSFFPGEVLDLETTYQVRLLPGLQDSFGNTLEIEKGFRFTTDELTFVVRSIDAFESGVTSNWWAPQQSGTTSGIITEQTNRFASTAVANLALLGNRSMQLDYGWDPDAGSWLIREFLGGGPPRSVTFDDSYILQMYIFGDGSGNQIRIALDDRVPTASASNHEVSIWYTVDWVGWRPVTWDLGRDPVGTWLGDGQLNGTLRIDSIQLTHIPGQAEQGTLYFDDLRLLKANPTSVSTPTGEVVPQAFALLQNYPNPFNPETTIVYRVARQAQQVRLVIYDILGRQVSVLVNEIKQPGEFTARWDGTDRFGKPVASGTYIYRLESVEFVASRKMLLLR